MTESSINRGHGQKRSLWIAYVFLLVCVVVLYILHFRNQNPGQQKETPKPVASAENTGPRIAFINSDILMEQYERVPEMVKSFEASTRGKETMIREKQKEFETKVSDFQKRLQDGSISMEIAQITEQQLIKEQEELMSLRDELSEQLAREEYGMNLELMEIVSKFLEDYNRTRKYDLIFNYNQGVNLFTANQAYDITSEVVEMLNQEYQLRKPKQ